jgi:hypothetical protein
MGQCGCGEMNPTVKFPGPDEAIYALEIYSSCHYCSTSAGVVMYRFGADDPDRDLWLDGVEEAKFLGYAADDPSGQFAVSVLDPAHLAAVLNEDQEDEDEADIRTWNIAFSLPEAVGRTLDDWRSFRAGAATEGEQR